jgi:hypothetical protein
MSSSDPSGMLRFLTDELQDSEDAGERGLCTFHSTALPLIFRHSMDHWTCLEWMGWYTSIRQV